MEILMDTPLLTPDSNNETNVNPVWRSSAFVMVYGVSYEYNATAAEMAQIKGLHKAYSATNQKLLNKATIMA